MDSSPLLTIVVPAYNAADYLVRALDPLLRVRRGIEVIVVDDGSTDGTGRIADRYADERPDAFRVIRQGNRGHGGAINAGLDAATGTYLKVLDADDWLSIPALEALLATLGILERDGGVDAVFTDYVHDRVGKSNRTTRFDSVFPERRLFEWAETSRFGNRQVLMMHAVVFRTALVRASGLRLPEHTFYVDNLYVLTPLVLVRSMYYLPVSLYHYFIGRADQSVAADVMLRRVDQQLFVNRLALRTMPDPAAVARGEIPVALQAAMAHYLEAVCAVTSATLARGGSAEHLAKRAALWEEIRTEDPWLHAKLRRSFIGASSNLPTSAGRHVTRLAYSVARRVVGFS